MHTPVRRAAARRRHDVDVARGTGAQDVGLVAWRGARDRQRRIPVAHREITYLVDGSVRVGHLAGIEVPFEETYRRRRDGD